jgi:hypothetical protein
MRGLLLVSFAGIPVPQWRIGEMSHAVFYNHLYRDNADAIIKTLIPIFPSFKKLEWSDRTEFESYSSWLAPHSDFNFVSIWAWDINETMKLSKLNDNLVIFFNDYLTGEHYLSLVGKNRIKETALELINFSKKIYGVSILKYVPEEIANEINNSDLIVEVDESNCDHVCFVSDLAESDKLTNASGNTGQHCRAFLKLYPQFQTKVCSINDVDINELKGLFEKWAENKNVNFYNLVEYKAFERYFQLKEDNIKILSIYNNDNLIGFQTIEILSKEYATCEFSKADVKYKWIYQFMQWKLCEYLQKKGIIYLNLQVDMGCFELRDSKINNYKSKILLRRFIVESQTKIEVLSSL